MRGAARVEASCPGRSRAAVRSGETLKEAQLYGRTDPRVHTLGEVARLGIPQGPQRRGYGLVCRKDAGGVLNQ
jgi:tRNA U38,U39,U40 pseudouridine synthase TruA